MAIHSPSSVTLSKYPVKTSILASSVIILAGALIAVSADAAYDFAPYKLTLAATSSAKADVGNSHSANNVATNELQRDHLLAKFSVTLPLGKEWSVGANLGYETTDYDWRLNQATVLRPSSLPWSSVKKNSAGLSVSYRPDQHWMFLVSPKVQYAYANTTSSSDAQSYGVVTSAMYRFASGNVLGFGVAYLNDINKVRTVPYLAVKWQVTDKLTLANPFQAGFSSPAGLELSYQLNDSWDVGVGTSKHTERFLIGDDKESIEIDEWVGFLRAGYALTPRININGYAGYYFAGEMELSQPQVTEDISSQMAAGITFDIKF